VADCEGSFCLRRDQVNVFIGVSGPQVQFVEVTDHFEDVVHFSHYENIGTTCLHNFDISLVVDLVLLWLHPRIFRDVVVVLTDPVDLTQVERPLHPISVAQDVYFSPLQLFFVKHF